MERKRGRGIPKITLVELGKKNMLIKEVTESIILNGYTGEQPPINLFENP
jgi:hypothetical protein